MATEGRNSGARLQARIAAADSDELRIGTEYQRYRLDDRWAQSGGMMMWPNTFVNINDGQRDHADLYVELESRWTSRWSTIAGVRGTRVTMNAGSVQGYSSMYAMAPAGYNANTFNTADRRRVDNNVDAALIGRYVSGHRTTFEVGVAQKTRSPNLYERYAWSGNGMAMTMNNWVNDGNGYVGNLALRPEVARTISATADWHDPGKAAHGAKLTLYYSRVADFIDATCANLPSCAAGQFNYLTLANQAAELYGADLSGFFRLGDASGPDGFFVRGTASYVRGRNTDTGDGLYNIMPANGRLSLEYENGAWHLSLENELVARKSKVSTVRTELDTGGYYLINLAASAEWHHVRFDLGVDNLFDRFYALPTGGAYIGQGRTMSLNGAGAAWGVAVPGPGRSLHAGLTVSF
jgi:iron complex outermembrane receptor protein